MIENTDELELIFPNEKYKSQVEKYKKAMLEAESGMDGCGTLRHDDFETWLKKCRDWQKGKNLPDGYVASTQYICVRKADNKVVGMLQIRHELSDFLLNFGGHIGDSIVPDERGKGYGKAIIALGLEKCKELGIKRVLITCKDSNIASKKCIVANGGQYEDTRTTEDEKIERYWVDMTK